MAVIKRQQASGLLKEAVVLDLGDIARQAARIEAAAQVKARQIEQTAQQRAAQLTEHASAEGFERGRVAGMTAGTDVGRREGREEAFEAMTAQLEQLRQSWLDAAHTAMLLYSEDGAAACKRFLERAGLLMDGTFRALLQALINTIPRTRIKGKFARPEAECLDALRLAFFDDLVVPAEAEPLVQQGSALLPFREVDEGNQEVDGDSEGDDTDDEE